jgi:hypothetical protein
MNNYKNESLVIFYCIITIIIFYFLCLLYNKTYKTYKEYFSSNDSKRSKMMKIYKGDETLDPDENPGLNIHDPDSSTGYDPD